MKYRLLSLVAMAAASSSTSFAAVYANADGLNIGAANTFSVSSMSIVSGSDSKISNSVASNSFGTYNFIDSENSSFIAGYNNSISTFDPFAPLISGGGNIVMGLGNAVNKINEEDSWYSIILGRENTTSESDSWVLGKGNNGQTNTVTLGTYATQVSSASLIVGIGTGFGMNQRANGLVVLKNGTVSIPSGNLQLGSDFAITPTYLTTNSYLKKQGPGATVSSTALMAQGSGASATGNDSIALGKLSSATATNAVALGVLARAESGNALAVGSNVYANSNGSIALGVNSAAINEFAFVGGVGAGASGWSSIALGTFSNTVGTMGAALGHHAQALADETTAVGKESKANGTYAAAFGAHAVASGTASIALGYQSFASGFGSSSLGYGSLASARGVVAAGSFNKGLAGSTTNWVESDPLLEVGNGVDSSNRSNAITTLKNGQTTLINKAWKAANPGTTPAAAVALADPGTTSDADSKGEALVVDGHTRLRGKVVIEQAQGDIAMGIYGN